MAKNDVDGVYSDDPKVNKSAKKYDNITYMEMLNKGLGIMDSTASSLCMDNEIPLIVFSIMEEGNIKKVIRSEEHTSELQSRGHLVCRLLLEKKKNDNNY